LTVRAGGVVDSVCGGATGAGWAGSPREGIYKWYGPMWGRDIAELTIRTAAGSNYFIKLEDMHERPARAYFLHGGLTQTFPVPLGTFALKYATGSSWCGEGEFFGDETVYHKADRTLSGQR
jgi:hypothetical protein